jgi:aspartyl-tRNA(Asn)/glutamyl-tRNA(Gln) amidotransferase subunit B
VLPVMNKQAVDRAIRFGLAVGAKIAPPRSSPAKLLLP